MELYFNTLLFCILIGINWISHFVINARKRKKKGTPYELNLKTLAKELLSLVVVLIISLGETMLLLLLFSLLS